MTAIISGMAEAGRPREHVTHQEGLVAGGKASRPTRLGWVAIDQVGLDADVLPAGNVIAEQGSHSHCVSEG